MQSSHSALKSPMKQSGFTCGHPSMPSMRAAEFERKKVMVMMNPISYWSQFKSPPTFAMSHNKNGIL